MLCAENNQASHDLQCQRIREWAKSYQGCVGFLQTMIMLRLV